mgnify:CR=1 FL=1
MAQSCELLIVGAGPAGLAAATQASGLGVDTVLIDEQPTPGGQIYRSITTTPLKDPNILGADYWYGYGLIEKFLSSGTKYLANATVWGVTRLTGEADEGFEVHYSTGHGGQAHAMTARRILLATGAQERPFPIPGWTLPGVVTAGAAQILLKTSGIAPGEGAVLAGCGPLLYLLAWQYLNAGVKVDRLLETTPPGRWIRALPHVPGFLLSPYLAKGLKLMRAVRSAIPIERHVLALQAVGRNRLESVSFRTKGRLHQVPASHLMLHQGVVPNVNLSRALGLDHVWNDRLACWEPRVDVWGETSSPGIAMAGDGAGIGGARAAEQQGRLAALQVAATLGRIDNMQRDRLAREPRQILARAMRGRAFFDELYQPPESYRRPSDDTIVCRCEEISARQVRETVRLGCMGPNQMKAFLRCGMGPCQGRMCGLTVSELIAEERGMSPAEVGYYRIRFPIKPVTLGHVASLSQTDASRHAVVRIRS